MAKKVNKEDEKGQVEGIFSELGKKIDQLINETKGAKDDVRVEMEKKINVLKAKKDQLEADFHAFKDKNEPKWTDAKGHLGEALEALKKALAAVVKK